MTCGLSPLARGTHRAGRRRFCRARFIPAGAGNTALRNCKTFLCTVYPRWRPHAPVYPRWRGEHEEFSGFVLLDDGLSPLARGTLHHAHSGKQTVRFIPAGAGNTSMLGNGHERPPVYPRWRGEHVVEYSSARSTSGLSPLARGTLLWINISGLKFRFIPAGAGNTGKAG